MINPIYYLYKIRPSHKKIIEDNFKFYRRLSNYDKKKFDYRVRRFIQTHKFVGREDIVITPVKKTVIASIAVMLTFRMSKYLYRQFENIIVYPKNYLSSITKHEHRGETNPRAKTIVFSWEGIVEGINVEDDNLNLGIHEFTHALYFSFLKDGSYEAMQFISNFKKVLEFLENKSMRDKLIKANYFRDYAFENQYEFLSVITENYFETPSDFHSKLPELFVMVNRLYCIY
jgi:Mlc titration factor MtfA (ptsG expression regulator)